MCKRHAEKNDLLRQGKGTSSDTERSWILVSVSLLVEFLFLSQQWPFWQLDIWQLPFFVCWNKFIPFFFLFPGFLNPEKYLLWGCHLLRLYLGAGCCCRSKTEEESACSYCVGISGQSLLQWKKALLLYFISYPFIFPCHLPLTTFAAVLYFVHRLLLFQIPGFVQLS